MAAQVDFYVLAQADPLARLRFCARLLPKILSQQPRCTILVGNATDAETLDAALWEQIPESFLPHVVVTEDETTADGEILEPITIRIGNPAPTAGVCINLHAEVPAQHADLNRVVEIVCQDPVILSTTREKYRFYRQLGYPLQSHSITTEAL